MAKSFQQLERECQATIKLVLVEMEALAAMDAAEAGNPYEFEARRRRVVRKIWGLFKDAVLYDAVGDGRVPKE